MSAAAIGAILGPTVDEIAELAHANAKRRRDALDRLIERRERGALAGVLARLDAEDNPYVLSRALTAAGALGKGQARVETALARFLDHKDPRVAANAVDALRALGARGAIAAVHGLLDTPHPRLRANAIVYLACTDAEFAPRPALEAMLSSARAAMQASALWALARVKLEAPLELVRMAAGASDPEVLDRARTLAGELAKAGDEDARLLVEEIDAGEATGGEAIALRVPPLPKRVWAWVADSVALALIALAVQVAIVVSSPPPGGSGGAVQAAAALGSRLQIVLLLYSIVFFVRDGFGGGRGFAKRYLGLRVVDLETRTGCGYLKSMLRQSTFYLPVLNVVEVIWAAYDAEGRRIIDHLLGTMVVDERQRPMTRLDRVLIGLVVAAFVAGIAALVFFFGFSTTVLLLRAVLLG